MTETMPGGDWPEREGRLYDTDVHAVVATLITLITDPGNALHKGGEPVGSAGFLVDDLSLTCDLIADDLEVCADDELLAEVLRCRKPRSFRNANPDDSGCRYVRAVAKEPRDSELLALAAVRAMARVVADGCDAHWLLDLSNDVTADLWLSPTESTEVADMVAAIGAAIDARFTVRRRPRRSR